MTFTLKAAIGERNTESDKFPLFHNVVGHYEYVSGSCVMRVNVTGHKKYATWRQN